MTKQLVNVEPGSNTAASTPSLVELHSTREAEKICLYLPTRSLEPLRKSIAHKTPVIATFATALSRSCIAIANAVDGSDLLG